MYSGTTVVNGSALAIVTKTGWHTLFKNMNIDYILFNKNYKVWNLKLEKFKNQLIRLMKWILL